MSLSLRLYACARTHNLTWSQKKTLTSWNRLIKHLEVESFILPLFFSIHGGTLEKLVIKPTGWIQGVTSQFFHLTSCVCLIMDQWGLSVTKSESVLSFVQPALWQCYRNTYWCFGIAGRSSFSFLLCYPSNTGLSQRGIILSPIFV